MQPPYSNGIMELTYAQQTEIYGRLLSIKTSFKPTAEQQYADTFYLAATYNSLYKDSPINGDTVDYIRGDLWDAQQLLR